VICNTFATPYNTPRNVQNKASKNDVISCQAVSTGL